MENITLLIIGIVLTVLGGVNISGNISTVHSYNRRNVKEEDIPKYGRAIGIGTSVIGIGIIVCAILTMTGLESIMPFVLIPSVVIGLVFILFAQFKYNKGIF